MMSCRLFAAADTPSTPQALRRTQPVMNTLPDFPKSGVLNVILAVMVARVPVVIFVATAANGLILKMATTLRAASMVTVHDPMPAQAPLQPAKILPASGVAVRVTFVPLA